MNIFLRDTRIVSKRIYHNKRYSSEIYSRNPIWKCERVYNHYYISNLHLCKLTRRENKIKKILKKEIIPKLSNDLAKIQKECEYFFIITIVVLLNNSKGNSCCWLQVLTVLK